MASPPRARFCGVTRLAVEDLLEELTHAGTHEIPPLGVHVKVAPPHPCHLARIEWLEGVNRLVARGRRAVVVHGGIVARHPHPVNPPAQPGGGYSIGRISRTVPVSRST